MYDSVATKESFLLCKNTIYQFSITFFQLNYFRLQQMIHLQNGLSHSLIYDNDEILTVISIENSNIINQPLQMENFFFQISDRHSFIEKN